jgi:hypothetical protein
MGRFTTSQLRSAARAAGKLKSTEIVFLDGRRVLSLLKNYLDGVSHVADVELPIKFGARGVLSSRDRGIESWSFSMSGEALAAVYRRAGDQIFARNIRGWQGETDINSDINETLVHNPRYFWYFNNGVTFVCDDAQMTGRAGGERIRLTDPQIINGQQTTRVLAHAASERSMRARVREAAVSVRVIRVPPTGPSGAMTFDQLVSAIVAASNRQNRIDPSDLRSNDRLQILIQRELRRLGYEYLRKRESKREARRVAGVQGRTAITKFELAQAVAGCEFESLPLREGKEPLFGRHYDGIFASDDVDYYLSRYLLQQVVRTNSRGQGDKRYGRWITLFFLWSSLGNALERDVVRLKKVVDRPWEDRKSARPLDTMAWNVIQAAYAFYVAKRGRGRSRLAADSFFKREYLNDRKRERLYSAFLKFWRSTANSQRRQRFSRARAEFVSRIHVGGARAA